MCAAKEREREGRDRSLSLLQNFDLVAKLGYNNLSYYLGAGLRGQGLHRVWQDCPEVRVRDPHRERGLLVESNTAFIAPPESVTKPPGRVVGARGLEGCGAPGAQAASREPRVAVRRGSVLPDPSRWEIRVGTPPRS